MLAKVILNPYANRWNAKKSWPQAIAALRAAGIDFELAVTEHRGHAVELAETAIQAGFSPIIVAGGDGLLGEVVNGLARAQGDGLWGPVGILPLGTANDLAHNLNLPLDLPSAARVIAAGKTRPMVVISVNGKYFDNNSAIGLEPLVTSIQVRMTRVQGVVRYLTAAMLGILSNPHWQAHLEWDDGQYDGPISLVTVGNGAVTGGLFYMTPHADPFDGKLTFVVGYRATSLGLLRLLPATMRPEGQWVTSKDVREIHATWLKIRLDRPSPLHADGELFPGKATDIEYRVHPGRIQMLMP
jgi:YegS/Rv2252/BmrU family lipid kinase